MSIVIKWRFVTQNELKTKLIQLLRFGKAIKNHNLYITFIDLAVFAKWKIKPNSQKNTEYENNEINFIISQLH